LQAQGTLVLVIQPDFGLPWERNSNIVAVPVFRLVLTAFGTSRTMIN
jgi:hypothetical protein